MIATAKKCRKCEQVKPLYGFGRNHLSADGYDGVCKVCVTVAHTLQPNSTRGNAGLRAKAKLAHEQEREARILKMKRKLAGLDLL